MSAPAAASKKGVRLDVDRTRSHLEQLGLSYASERLGGLLSEAVKGDMPPHRFLDELLDEEVGRREERRIKTSLRLSGLPPGQTLGGFDFSFQPGIEKSRIETLATCAWVREKEGLLLAGPPGVGKTHLAVALGVKAVEHGFSVAFFRLDDLLHALKRDQDLPPRRLRSKKYMKVALLIIDEVGFQPLNRLEAHLFFRVVSYRYQRGSMLVTTNKAVKDWAEVLAGDEVMTTALLDRLLHRCHMLSIKGRSYRLRDLERQIR
jgi:DNA replication protein DnaC